MRSRWLDWQPNQCGSVGFEGSHLWSFPIIQPAVREEGVSSAGSQTQLIEKVPSTVPTKPTKPAANESCETHGQIPPMPRGVRLLRWESREPPVGVVHMGVVTDVPRFVWGTLCQLDAALRGEPWRAGHWTARELVDRLEQCGVSVEIESVVSRDK
jgi:hypothetical protein